MRSERTGYDVLRGLRESTQLRTSGPVKTEVYSPGKAMTTRKGMLNFENNPLTCSYGRPREAVLSYEHKSSFDLLTPVHGPC